MSLRHAHVPTEQLAALALAGTGEEGAVDRETLDHVSVCETCSVALSHLVVELDELRDEAFHEADRHFSEAALEAQRSRILDRLAHLGHAARVLPFPIRALGAPHARPTVNRRWVTAAAAAGLLIGLATGQMMHLGPWDTPRHPDPQPAATTAAATTTVPRVPISATASLTDYVSLTEVDSSVQLRRAADVQVFDALTPAPSDVLGR